LRQKKKFRVPKLEGERSLVPLSVRIGHWLQNYCLLTNFRFRRVLDKELHRVLEPNKF